MRLGGWYRLGKRGGVFVSTTVGHHGRRAAAVARRHGARHPVAFVVFLLLLLLLVVMLLAAYPGVTGTLLGLAALGVVVVTMARHVLR